jgi:predicted nucleotidyltransferase
LDLIGSAARGDFGEKSDVDVLVTFEGDEKLFDRYFELKQCLERLFNRKVDVIEERAIKNPILKRVLREIGSKFMEHDPKGYIFDILQACKHIQQFTAGKSFDEYTGDILLKSAVERQFAIIGEALSRVKKRRAWLVRPN